MKAKGNVIYFKFDKWISPSTKDSEWNDRASVKTSFQVTGSSQKRPSNWLEPMKNKSFKISLNKLLEWQLVNWFNWRKKTVCQLWRQMLQISSSFELCCSDVVMRQDCTTITKNSRVFFHVSCLAENYSSKFDVNVVVRATDTDRLIIAVGCFQTLLEKHQKLRLWLEMGVETKNILRYVTLN